MLRVSRQPADVKILKDCLPLDDELLNDNEKAGNSENN
jgi:hypothetical protein